jgi:hypothetical protein
VRPTQQELGPRAPLTVLAAACETHARKKVIADAGKEVEAPHDAVLFIFWQQVDGF